MVPSRYSNDIWFDIDCHTAIRLLNIALGISPRPINESLIVKVVRASTIPSYAIRLDA